MKPHSILLVPLALAGGVAGFLLRNWQRATAYDPTTQLMEGSAPATLALLGLLVAVVALSAALSWGRPRPEEPEQSFLCPNPLYLVLMAASALAFFAAAVLGAPELSQAFRAWQLASTSTSATPTPFPVVQLVSLFLCLVGGMGTLLTGRNNFRCLSGKHTRNWSTLPAYAALPWLIAIYQKYSVSAILPDVFVPILTAVFLLLGLYRQSAYYFGRPRPVLTGVCSVLGIALAGAALADSPAPSDTLIILALSLANLAGLLALAFPAPSDHREAPTNPSF